MPWSMRVAAFRAVSGDPAGGEPGWVIAAGRHEIVVPGTGREAGSRGGGSVGSPGDAAEVLAVTGQQRVAASGVDLADVVVAGGWDVISRRLADRAGGPETVRAAARRTRSGRHGI